MRARTWLASVCTDREAEAPMGVLAVRSDHCCRQSRHAARRCAGPDHNPSSYAVLLSGSRGESRDGGARQGAGAACCSIVCLGALQAATADLLKGLLEHPDLTPRQPARCSKLDPTQDASAATRKPASTASHIAHPELWPPGWAEGLFGPGLASPRAPPAAAPPSRARTLRRGEAAATRLSPPAAAWHATPHAQGCRRHCGV